MALQDAASADHLGSVDKAKPQLSEIVKSSHCCKVKETTLWMVWHKILHDISAVTLLLCCQQKTSTQLSTTHGCYDLFNNFPSTTIVGNPTISLTFVSFGECIFQSVFETILIDRSTTTPKTTSRWRWCRNDAKNHAKTVQNCSKMIQNDLKIVQKRSENCTFVDGPIASDCFEFFGLVWNLIL